MGCIVLTNLLCPLVAHPLSAKPKRPVLGNFSTWFAYSKAKCLLKFHLFLLDEIVDGQWFLNLESHGASLYVLQFKRKATASDTLGDFGFGFKC